MTLERKNLESQELKDQGIALAEGLAGFGGGYASVGGQAIEMIERFAGRPDGEGGLAGEVREEFLEAVVGESGEGIARGDGAAGAGIATFKMNGADLGTEQRCANF